MRKLFGLQADEHLLLDGNPLLLLKKRFGLGRYMLILCCGTERERHGDGIDARATHRRCARCLPFSFLRHTAPRFKWLHYSACFPRLKPKPASHWQMKQPIGRPALEITDLQRLLISSCAISWA